jgi:hypothetical protein
VYYRLGRAANQGKTLAPNGVRGCKRQEPRGRSPSSQPALSR